MCAYNDETALAVLAGLHLRGLRAPDDLAVLGVGQVSIPPLTTVAFDYGQTGPEIAQAVAQALREGRPAPHSTLASPELVRRASA